jgi:hypothetical protein
MQQKKYHIRKTLTCTNIRVSENLGEFLYNAKHKWETQLTKNHVLDKEDELV